MNWVEYSDTANWPTGSIVVMMTVHMSEQESYICMEWVRDDAKWAPKSGGPIRKFLMLEPAI